MATLTRTRTVAPDIHKRRLYERDAAEYCRALPLEHFMESTAQSTQREIFHASFAQVHAVRSEIQYFGELLIQYPKATDTNRIGKVVPDNMVVVHPEPIKADGSYMLDLQPVDPIWVLEYTSKGNERKDYVENRTRYETDLRVPYYLIFNPEDEELILLKLKRGRYSAVPPNAHGRLPVPELDIEVGVADGWLRFWFEGQLLQLPAELASQVNALKVKLSIANREIARLKTQLGKYQNGTG